MTMLLTPITDATKASHVALKSKTETVKQVVLSNDVIDWLCKVKTKQVYVVGLAVDFYLASFMQDILMKRIAGENGFDPSTGYDYYIVNDVNFNAWIGSLQASVNKSIAWQDSFMFTYLCAAVAGELRHCPASVSSTDKQKLTAHGVLGDHQENDLIRAMTQKRFLQTVTVDTIRPFLQVAVDVFQSGKWGSGYGGPKWGEIAVTGLNRFDNKLTPSQFIDRVYDLKHNGGPMFDKNKAVVNEGLPSFLDAKFHAIKDSDWTKWMNKYASKLMREFICRAQELNLWQGSKPSGLPFRSIIGEDEDPYTEQTDAATDDDTNEPPEPAHILGKQFAVSFEDEIKAVTTAAKKVATNDKGLFTMPSLNKEPGKCVKGHELVVENLALSVPEKA